MARVPSHSSVHHRERAKSTSLASPSWDRRKLACADVQDILARPGEHHEEIHMKKKKKEEKEGEKKGRTILRVAIIVLHWQS